MYQIKVTSSFAGQVFVDGYFCGSWLFYKGKKYPVTTDLSNKKPCVYKTKNGAIRRAMFIKANLGQESGVSVVDMDTNHSIMILGKGQ